MRVFLSSLVSPLPLLSLMLLAVFLFRVTHNKRLMRWSVALMTIWFFLIATPFLPQFLLCKLESKTIPLSNRDMINLQLADSSINILILGSAYASDNRLSNTAMLNTNGLARLTEAIRLSRLFPEATLVFSGYNGRQPWPQAEIGARAAEELGISPSKIETIPEPWNTKDEARFYKEKYGTTKAFVLITDAAHMPRALYHFRKANLNPIPAPTNYRIRKNDISKTFTYYLPSSQNIAYSEIIFHEYLGLLWAKLGGD